jgi:hypothetical protein
MNLIANILLNLSTMHMVLSMVMFSSLCSARFISDSDFVCEGNVLN